MNPDAQTDNGHVEDLSIDAEQIEAETPEDTGSELAQIRELFESAQLDSGHEFDLPGYDGRFTIQCRLVNDAEWNLVEKMMQKAGKRDDRASRNMKLDILIKATEEFRYRRAGETQSVSLQEAAPEIVGTDDAPIRFGDPRLADFLATLGSADKTSARQQLMALCAGPIKVVNLFTDYYEWASGELDDAADGIEGE